MSDIKMLHLYSCELDVPTREVTLPTPLMHQDAYADVFRIHVTRGGLDLQLDGMTVRAWLYLAATGETMLLEGSADGSLAMVTLEPECYLFPGYATLAIQLQQGKDCRTLIKINLAINRTSSDVVIVPGNVLPTLPELLAQIAAMEQATAKANTAAANADAAREGIQGDLAVISEDMSQYNAADELAGLDFPGTAYNGITVAWNGHTATITGTSTAAVNSTMYVNETGFPGSIEPGKLLNIHIDNTDENVQFHIYSYVNGEWSDMATFKRGADVVQYMLPEDAKGILMRLYVPAGVTVNGTLSIGITAAESNSILEQGGPVLLGDTGHYMHKTIERALAAYGCVTLGKGEFMVTGIEMPDNTIIRGCGAATVIKADSGCDGIIVGANCTIENVSIEGADGRTSSRGTTAGVRVVGNYDEAPAKFNTKINNVNIKGFSLAGIYGKSTGYWVANSISATNCKIHNCYAGILLEDYCEFGRFTNMLCYDNYAGLYNMSGNNVFVNCSFPNNTVGVYLEGGEADGVLGGNNGHGALIGCTINHSNNNAGYGIICRGITNGFIFDSCHLWYNKVMVEQSNGIIIQGCTFGGGATAFTAWTNSAFFLKNCLFKESPSFNGHSVVASGNYLFDGTELVVNTAEE